MQSQQQVNINPYDDSQICLHNQNARNHSTDMNRNGIQVMAYANLIVKYKEEYIVVTRSRKKDSQQRKMFPGGTVDQDGMLDFSKNMKIKTEDADSKTMLAAFREFEEETSSKEDSLKNLLAEYGSDFEQIKNTITIAGLMNNTNQIENNKLKDNTGLHITYMLDLEKALKGRKNKKGKIFDDKRFDQFYEDLELLDDLEGGTKSKLNKMKLPQCIERNKPGMFTGGFRTAVENIIYFNGEKPCIATYYPNRENNCQTLPMTQTEAACIVSKWEGMCKLKPESILTETMQPTKQPEIKNQPSNDVSPVKTATTSTPPQSIPSHEGFTEKQNDEAKNISKNSPISQGQYANIYLDQLHYRPVEKRDKSLKESYDKAVNNQKKLQQSKEDSKKPVAIPPPVIPKKISPQTKTIDKDKPLACTIQLRADQRIDQSFDDKTVIISAPLWVQDALKKLSDKLFAGKDSISLTIAESKSEVIQPPLTLKHLVTLARNEPKNISGVIKFTPLYPNFAEEDVYALKDLVKHCVIVGKDMATHTGGYPKSKLNESTGKHEPVYPTPLNKKTPVYVCDLPGLQFQQAYNTGRLVLIGEGLPKGFLDDDIYQHTVGEKKDIEHNLNDISRYLPGSHHGKKVHFDKFACKKFVMQDFILAGLALNEAAKRDSIKKNEVINLNYKFLAYGSGCFLEGLTLTSRNKTIEIQKIILEAIIDAIPILFSHQPKRIKHIDLPYYETNNEEINALMLKIKKLCDQYSLGFSYTRDDALTSTKGLITATTNCSDPHVVTGNEMNHGSVDAAIAENVENKLNHFSPILNPVMQAQYVSAEKFKPAVTTEKVVPKDEAKVAEPIKILKAPIEIILPIPEKPLNDIVEEIPAKIDNKPVADKDKLTPDIQPYKEIKEPDKQTSLTEIKKNVYDALVAIKKSAVPSGVEQKAKKLELINILQMAEQSLNNLHAEEKDTIAFKQTVQSLLNRWGLNGINTQNIIKDINLDGASGNLTIAPYNKDKTYLLHKTIDNIDRAKLLIEQLPEENKTDFDGEMLKTLDKIKNEISLSDDSTTTSIKTLEEYNKRIANDTEYPGLLKEIENLIVSIKKLNTALLSAITETGPLVIDNPNIPQKLAIVEELEHKAPNPEVLEAPNPEVLEAPNPEVLEAPNPEVLEAPNPEVLEAPNPEVLEAPKPEPKVPEEPEPVVLEEPEIPPVIPKVPEIVMPPITLELPLELKSTVDKYAKMHLRIADWLMAEIILLANSNTDKENMKHLIERTSKLKITLEYYEERIKVNTESIGLDALDHTILSTSISDSIAKLQKIIDADKLAPDKPGSLYAFNEIACFSDDAKIIIPPQNQAEVMQALLTQIEKSSHATGETYNKAGGLSSGYFNVTDTFKSRRITSNSFEIGTPVVKKQFIAIQKKEGDGRAEIEFRFDDKDIEALSIGNLLILAGRQVEDFRCLVKSTLSTPAAKLTDSFSIPINILPGTHPKLASAIQHYCRLMEYDACNSPPSIKINTSEFEGNEATKTLMNDEKPTYIATKIFGKEAAHILATRKRDVEAFDTVPHKPH